MPETTVFDLYTFVQDLVAAEWMQEIYIFGSRRYLSNASFGSDIDLLFVTNTPIASAVARGVITEPYIDAFLLRGNLATSIANETQIEVESDNIVNSLQAVKVWTRESGWQTAGNYRFFTIFPNKAPKVTIATAGSRPALIFAALPQEFRAVLDRLPAGKNKIHQHLPPHYLTHITCASGRKRLIAVVQTGVASVNAGIAATRMLDYFDQPELAILVGITAGIKRKGIKLGDVIVPTATVDVESGKVTPKGKEKAGLSIPVSGNYHKALAGWSGTAEWIAKWKRRSKKKVTPNIHSEFALACTSSVIAYDKYAQKFRDWNRKIGGIEMEALGIALATHERCPLLVIKAISDWADIRKDDKFHKYCMKLSADLAVSLLEDETL